METRWRVYRSLLSPSAGPCGDSFHYLMFHLFLRSWSGETNVSVGPRGPSLHVSGPASTGTITGSHGVPGERTGGRDVSVYTRTRKITHRGSLTLQCVTSTQGPTTPLASKDLGGRSLLGSRTSSRAREDIFLFVDVCRHLPEPVCEGLLKERKS